MVRRVVATFMVSCLAFGASQAVAAECMSDAAYIQAMRCGGLATANGMNVAALEATLKVQKRNRADHVAEAAKEARRAGQSEARRGTRTAQIEAELAGACAAYLAPVEQLTGARERMPG